MFQNTHTNVLKLMVVLGLAAAMLVPANAQVTTDANTSTTGTVSTGSPIIETTFDIINTRTNTDATTTPAKPGDILRVTAKIKNAGTGTLTMIPRIISEELFKLGPIVDAGDGGLPQGQNAIAFPQISLEPNCNCEEEVAFSVEIQSNVCVDLPSLASGNIVVMFQDKVKRIALECPAPVTPTPVTPAPTPSTPAPTPKPPKVPDTGPEALLALSLALAGGTTLAARRLFRRK